METSGNPLQAANDDLVLIAFSALKGHGRQIVRWAAAATGLAVLIGGAYFWTQHVERRSSAVVRLTFAGADKGTYPTGLPFAPADLIGTAGLDAVYDRHDVARVCGREDFRRAFAVVPEPPQPGTAYRLSMARNGACAALSEAAAGASLTDALSLWAAEAASKRGVLAPRVPILTASLFDGSADNTHGLYTKLGRLQDALDRAIGNVKELRGLAGADAFRSGATSRSLRDVEVSLRDLADARFDAALLAGAGTYGPDVARWVAHALEDSQAQLRGTRSLAEVYLTALRGYTGAGASDQAAAYRQSLADIYIRQSLASFEAEQKVEHFKKLASARRVSGGSSDREIEAALDQIIADARGTMGEFAVLAEEFERLALGPAKAAYQVEQGPQTVTVKALSARQFAILVGAVLLGSLAIGMLAAILYDQFLMTPPVTR